MSETRDGARRRQELRRSNAAVPIPSRKVHRPADQLRAEIDDEATNGLHPEELCGRDCTGCMSPEEWQG